ncbi:H-NS histone family protein [Vibrio hepatarius]|uniref:H-NS histone family protein n=1 Tax=Vibrio hepatarius TaxID=171383 RepID=UPI001C09D681|nr:H-NS family nucleoid-associated regulatory protein [Vibrio hepatarius]MBU2898306.1 H-NS histone family protein [Vibrio hepatarius]
MTDNTDIKTLLNDRSLRAATKGMSTEELESALDKLNLVLTEKKEFVKAEEQRVERKNNECAEILSLLSDSEVTLEELVYFAANSTLVGFNPESEVQTKQKRQKAKRAPRPAKYKYTNEQGEEKTWTGQGRTPSVIQAALDKGAHMSQFKIAG